MTSEFAYPDPDTLPGELREAVTQRASLNIFRMISHTPNLAPGFLSMAADVLQHNSLPASSRELVILRVGYRYQAGYQTYQHVNIGRAIGMREDAIAAAESGATDGLDEREALLLSGPKTPRDEDPPLQLRHHAKATATADGRARRGWAATCAGAHIASVSSR